MPTLRDLRRYRRRHARLDRDGSWGLIGLVGAFVVAQVGLDGTTYCGEVFRSWVDVGAHRPKVCDDPAGPASHTVVDGDDQCGRG